MARRPPQKPVTAADLARQAEERARREHAGDTVVTPLEQEKRNAGESSRTGGIPEPSGTPEEVAARFYAKFDQQQPDMPELEPRNPEGGYAPRKRRGGLVTLLGIGMGLLLGWECNQQSLRDAYTTTTSAVQGYAARASEKIGCAGNLPATDDTLPRMNRQGNAFKNIIIYRKPDSTEPRPDTPLPYQPPVENANDGTADEQPKSANPQTYAPNQTGARDVDEEDAPGYDTMATLDVSEADGENHSEIQGVRYQTEFSRLEQAVGYEAGRAEQEVALLFDKYLREKHLQDSGDAASEKQECGGQESFVVVHDFAAACRSLAEGFEILEPQGISRDRYELVMRICTALAETHYGISSVPKGKGVCIYLSSQPEAVPPEMNTGGK